MELPQDRMPPFEPPLLAEEIPLSGSDRSAVYEMFARPNVWMSAAWTFTFFMCQMAVALMLALVAAIWYVLRHGIGELSPAAMIDELGMGTMILGGSLGNLLFAIAVPAIFFRAQVVRTLALRGIAFRHVCLTILMVLPLGLVAGEVSRYAADYLPSPLLGGLLEQLSLQSVAFLVVVIAVFPGIAEEVFFRGFLGRGLVARHGLVLGTLLASLLFGLAHVDPVHACGTFVLGVGLQAVFLSTRSLSAAILLHSLNNALAVALMKFGPSGDPAGLKGEEHLPISLAITALGASVGVCVLFYGTRTRWLLPDGQEWSPGYVTAEMPPASVNATPVCSRPKPVTVLISLTAYAIFAATLILELSRAA